MLSKKNTRRKPRYISRSIKVIANQALLHNIVCVPSLDVASNESSYRQHSLISYTRISNVGLLLNELNNEADRVALLAIDGYPVVVEEKVNSLDEGMLNDKHGAYSA